MNEDKNKKIYQADDRNFPLNEMRQDLIDDWLNEKPFAHALLFYELSAIERANKQ
jgi:hypothetical protein